MDRATLENLQRALDRKAAPRDIRNDLWSYLDKAERGDEDSIDLALILEKMELPEALEEFRRLLTKIIAREAPR
jgi:hypothetical protein